MIERIKQDWLPFIAFVLLGICVILLFKRCEPPRPVQVATIPEQAQKTKVRTIVKWKAIVQTNEVIKWKVYKDKAFKDTANPCGNEIRFVIQKADTVFKADSSLIASQQELIRLDSIIFAKTVANKNDTINMLTKEVKKQKWQKKGIIAAWVLREGVGVANKIKH